MHELTDACGTYRLGVRFLAYTGVRFGEMAALRVQRLDLLRRRAVIAEAVTLVRGVKGGPLRAQVVRRAVLTEAAAELGPLGLHPHALRHTAASLAIASGANIKVVQHLENE